MSGDIPAWYIYLHFRICQDWDAKKFGSFLRFLFQRLHGSLPGAPGAKTPGCWDPGQLGLVLLREFGSLWEEFRSLDSSAAHQAPGARTPESYPQVINRFFYIREFGSLKALDKNRDPWAVLRTNRALGTRSFRRGPWFCIRETIWPPLREASWPRYMTVHQL